MTLLSFSFALLLEFKWTISNIIRDTSAVGLTVIVILILMSVFSLAVMLERYLSFNSAARQSREFIPKVAEMLKDAHLDQALNLSKNYGKSHLALVVNSGLQELTNTNVTNPLRKAKRAQGNVTMDEPLTVAAASYPALAVGKNGTIYCSFVQNGRLMLQTIAAERLTALSH